MDPRRPIIAANWKMNKTLPDALAYVSALREEKDAVFQGVDVVIAPPFTLLRSLHEALKGSGIGLAAQNLFWEESGAYTGEVSAAMIVDAGSRYVIIGHSERRHVFGETDEMIRKKVDTAFRKGLVPILCVGETLQERQKGETFRVIDRQLKEDIAGLTGEQVAGSVLAYEPVWAIGTGQTATPEAAVEVHRHIRECLREMFGTAVSDRVRIQYGGSVTPGNISELMERPEIDGALVGGAGLKVDSFKEIIYNAGKVKGVFA
jgi:triosephosphate isomerase